MDEQANPRLTQALAKIADGFRDDTISCLVLFAKFKTEPDRVDEVTITHGIGEQELEQALRILEIIRSDVISASGINPAEPQ